MNHRRHPYPSSHGAPPRFSSKHEAAAFLRDYVADGHIRKCAHVSIRDWGRFTGDHEFGPDCRHNSFEMADSDRYIRDFFVGCPRNCAYFTPVWWARTMVGLRAFGRALSFPFRAFGALPQATQIIVVFALLVIVLAALGSIKGDQLIALIERVVRAVLH